MLEPANTICIASDVNKKLFMAACLPAKIHQRPPSKALFIHCIEPACQPAIRFKRAYLIIQDYIMVVSEGGSEKLHFLPFGNLASKSQKQHVEQVKQQETQ